jgi:thiamine biosynthesis lipoprotein
MPSPLRVAEASGQRLRRARPLLGTLVEIAIEADRPPGELLAASDAAYEAIAQVQALMSYHDAASQLSRLNRLAAREPQPVAPAVYEVIDRALQLARLSDGAFDPCVGGLLETWGLLPAVDAAPPAPAACWRDVELLDDCRVRFRRNLRMDLGGIAKGYAVDCAVHSLRAAGMSQILVNAGGDLRVAGERGEHIHVRDPRMPAATAYALDLRDGAIATSSACFSRRAFEGLSALIDPATGSAYLGGDSVTVRAADCMTADALTKVVLFAPAEIAERALTACDASAFRAG